MNAWAARGLALSCAFAAALATADERTLELPNGETIVYETVTTPAQSARNTADQILQFLSRGDLESAAVLSNAPSRRFEVLRDYRDSVGEAEFKRVFTQYLAPQNRLIAELAIGPRRLLIWELADAGHQLTAQYYVEVEGKFVMDDVPGPERAKLQRVLQAYRSGRINPSERKD